MKKMIKEKLLTSCCHKGSKRCRHLDGESQDPPVPNWSLLESSGRWQGLCSWALCTACTLTVNCLEILRHQGLRVTSGRATGGQDSQRGNNKVSLLGPDRGPRIAPGFHQGPNPPGETSSTQTRLPL